MKKKNQTIYLLNLLLLGLRAKFISLFSKILMNRELGVEAMGLFSLVNPLIVLLISLSSLSLPNAIATLISKYPKKDKKILISSFVIFVSLSLILMIIMFSFDEFIATNIIKNSNVIHAIHASILMIPLTSLSSIIKGYFLGKGQIKLTSSSQTFEEAGRLLYLLIIIIFYSSSSAPYKASYAIYSLAFGEIFQISYMILFSNINKRKILPTFFKYLPDYKDEIKPILNISIPLTLSRIIGSITYFLETIIFTNVMLNNNFSIDYITIEYGILSSYVMPLLLMPSFISLALSNYLLPNMGKLINENNHKKAFNLFKKILFLSLFIGLFISIGFYLFSSNLLNILYSSSIGDSYLKTLCFPFVLYYIETPIITLLNIYELPKYSFISTLISSLTRLILLIPLINYFGVIGISFATLISIIIDILLNLLFFFIFIKRNKIKIIG